MCAKYQRCGSIGIGDMIIFRNFNADLEIQTQTLDIKVKVTGVKNLMCVENSCPRAYVCYISKVYLNWYRRYDNF